MAVEHAAHKLYDSGERKFSGEEALDRDFVRSVEHGRHRATFARRGVRERDGRKTLRIDREKLERPDLRQIEPRE